jgi:hypothetical protein
MSTSFALVAWGCTALALLLIVVGCVALPLVALHWDALAFLLFVALRWVVLTLLVVMLGWVVLTLPLGPRRRGGLGRNRPSLLLVALGWEASTLLLVPLDWVALTLVVALGWVALTLLAVVTLGWVSCPPPRHIGLGCTHPRRHRVGLGTTCPPPSPRVGPRRTHLPRRVGVGSFMSSLGLMPSCLRLNPGRTHSPPRRCRLSSSSSRAEWVVVEGVVIGEGG